MRPAPEYRADQPRDYLESGEVIVRGNDIFYVDKVNDHILWKLNEAGTPPHQWEEYSDRVKN